jgi:hypothetical protein
MKKRRNGSRGFTYRSYSFKTKDPVIDRVRTILQDEGLSNNDAHIISGVSTTTLHNWFEGETRRPQYATVAAIISSVGYEAKFVKEKKINYERELEKARKEIQAAAAASKRR